MQSRIPSPALSVPGVMEALQALGKAAHQAASQVGLQRRRSTWCACGPARSMAARPAWICTPARPGRPARPASACPPWRPGGMLPTSMTPSGPRWRWPRPPPGWPTGPTRCPTKSSRRPESTTTSGAGGPGRPDRRDQHLEPAQRHHRPGGRGVDCAMGGLSSTRQPAAAAPARWASRGACRGSDPGLYFPSAHPAAHCCR
jgi:hypothetical protein